MTLAKEKRRAFLYRLFCPKKIFITLVFISMYSVLNTLSECTYFYISKIFTSHTFFLAFKIVKSLQCILKLFTSLILSIHRSLIIWIDFIILYHFQTHVADKVNYFISYSRLLENDFVNQSNKGLIKFFNKAQLLSNK